MDDVVIVVALQQATPKDVILTPVPSIDVTPDAFSFTDRTDVTLGQVLTSNQITVAGLTSGISVTVTLTGGLDAGYIKNGAPKSTTPTTAQDGDTFRLNHTASLLNSTATDTTLTIGGVSDTFTSTTLAVGTGTALPASTMTRTSGVTTYPPTVSFTRPIEWIDGDQGVMQRSQDATFATGVNEATNTLYAATTTYAWGLSLIASGVWYFRLAAWRGTRPGSLIWSNIQGVGDAVAPTITSSAAPTGYQFATGSLALTANKAATWEIVGGSGASEFSLTGSTLNWLDEATTGTFTVLVQATSYFGVASTVQTVTLTVGANTPSAFAFTDVTNATLSTVYTSNTITIAGIVGGVSVPVSVAGGTYSKNGGAYVSTAGTVVNGDTIAVRQTSAAVNNSTSNVVFTAGVTSDTYSVATPFVLTFYWNSADKNAAVNLSGTPAKTATISGSSAVGVRSTIALPAGRSYLEVYIDASASGLGNLSIGMVKSTESLSTFMGSDTGGHVVLFQSGGAEEFYNNNRPGVNYISGGFAKANTLCLDIDNTAKTMAFRKNGGTWTAAYSISALTGAWYLGFSSDQAGDSALIRSAASEMLYSIPSGASTID